MSGTVITDEELGELKRFVSARYQRSCESAEMVRALDDHNDRVYEHADEIADGEGLDPDERQLLRTIAVLHDAAKAETHLMLHNEAGARLAREKLTALGKDDGFIEAVERGIRCHMGPFPFVEEEARKYAERTGDHIDFPRPRTKVDRLFYDADMLALMDVQGIEKIVTLRQRTPEFRKEDEETARRRGITSREAAYRSAMQSVQRAAETLHCDTAKRIAERLRTEAEEHIARQLHGEASAAS